MFKYDACVYIYTIYFILIKIRFTRNYITFILFIYHKIFVKEISKHNLSVWKRRNLWSRNVNRKSHGDLIETMELIEITAPPSNPIILSSMYKRLDSPERCLGPGLRGSVPRNCSVSIFVRLVWSLELRRNSNDRSWAFLFDWYLNSWWTFFQKLRYVSTVTLEYINRLLSWCS